MRETQGGILVYDITDIERVNPKSGRVQVRVHGAFYMKHGKNCWHPKGQTTLVVPTATVLAWALEHPRGAVGFVNFKASDCPFR